ncbi:MAG: polysaccharide lyase [Prevotellaceae bacterium]|jgi:hypothetical protein|nr:polysaccharide lyase [Prevotellaceae bacterium]
MKKFYFLFISALTAMSSAFAQYPVLTKELAAQEAEFLKMYEETTNAAWEKAKPVVEKEAKEGRPYVPSATRSEDLTKAEIPAFPGAEGGGMWTRGGRGGRVMVVTSLADSGAGTFREACEAGGARIIVFNVSGVIRLTRPLSIRAPYVTIAGQTAPGDGVVITGETVDVDAHDVIIRHMRFRRGETNVLSRNDALSGEPIGNIIYDHLSCTWGLDENVSMYRHMYLDENGKNNKLPSVNVTMQNCITAEALDTYNHSFGSTIGGVNSTFMRNLFSSNAGRNPSMSSSEFHFFNNVIHNWSHRTGDGSGRAYNVMNNYFKPGPVTKAAEPIGYRVFRANGRGKTAGWVYVGGNIVEGNKAVSEDNWNGGVQDNHLAEDLAFMRAKEPLPITNPVTITSAEKAYEFVLANAGATLPTRDVVDSRIIRQVKTNKIEWVEVDNSALQESMKVVRMNRRLPADSYKMGIIYDIRQVGGLPAYKGKSYADADKDGMPDAWEKKYNLNPNDASDANGDLSGDGYTNIEKYINGIDPNKKVDWKNPKNNHDTLLGKKSLL